MSSTMTMSSEGFARRSSSFNKEKFPDFDGTHLGEYLVASSEQNETTAASSRTPSPAKSSSALPSPRWQRDDKHLSWMNGNLNVAPPRQQQHWRQRSLSDAFKTIRSRKASLSENAHELAEALKAPVSIKIIFLCLVWYLSSALTNTSSKSILNAFPKPISLTLIQFAFVSGWCLVLAFIAKLFPSIKSTIPALKNGIRFPTRDVISTTLPLAFFQIGGHILSSVATERIPVSLVHTIKGLSPLFTVLAYRFIYEIHYPTATYLSLIPLTLGVVLACSVEFGGNLSGVLCAFGGTLVFVSQNIFSKKLFNAAREAEADGPSTAASQRKLDKLNLLCYCSGLAFVLTFPIWLWTDAVPLYSAPLSLSPHKTPSSTPESSAYIFTELFFNGIFHFTQNMLAFILLSLVSPVTYSVASLIKRVFVIVVAIVWFGNSTTLVQGTGIVLTFFGLYLYDRTSDSAKATRRAKMESMRIERPILPLSSKDNIIHESPMSGELSALFHNPYSKMNGIAVGEEKRADAAGPGRVSQGESPWLPPGTKQEETWKAEDMSRSI